MEVDQTENEIEDLLNESEDEDGEDDDRNEKGRRRRRRMSIPAEMQLPEGSTKYTRRGRGVKKPGEAFQELLAYLMNLLVKKDTNKWFSVPMNDRIAPGYSETVKEPMDFTTMENNLDTQGYNNVKEMKLDFELICKNAMIFNRPETRYYKAAKRLQVYGLQILSRGNVREIVKERPAFSSLTRFELGFDVDDIGDTDEEDFGLLFDEESRSQSDSATESGPIQSDEVFQNTNMRPNPGLKSFDLKEAKIKEVSVRLKRGRKRKESPGKLNDTLESNPEQNPTLSFGYDTPLRKSNSEQSPNLNFGYDAPLRKSNSFDSKSKMTLDKPHSVGNSINDVQNLETKQLAQTKTTRKTRNKKSPTPKSNGQNPKNKQKPEQTPRGQNPTNEEDPVPPPNARIHGNESLLQTSLDEIDPIRIESFVPTPDKNIITQYPLSVERACINIQAETISDGLEALDRPRLEQRFDEKVTEDSLKNVPISFQFSENNPQTETETELMAYRNAQMPQTPKNLLMEFLAPTISSEDEKLHERNNENYATNFQVENCREEEVIGISDDIGQTVSEPNDNVSDYYYSEETYTHKKFGQRNYFKQNINAVNM